MSPIMRDAFLAFEKYYPTCRHKTYSSTNEYDDDYKELDQLLEWWQERNSSGFSYGGMYENEIWDFEDEKFQILVKHHNLIWESREDLKFEIAPYDGMLEASAGLKPGITCYVIFQDNPCYATIDGENIFSGTLLECIQACNKHHVNKGVV